MNLVVFDFDHCLIFSATDTPENRKKWSDYYGVDYSSVHNGWYGNVESLNMDVFYPTLNTWTHTKYIDEIANTNNKVYLATGRLKKKEGMEERVRAICDMYSLVFDDIFLCHDARDTFDFKTKLFEKLIIETPNIEIFTMYDDRHEHLVKFVDWREVMIQKYNIQIKIIDVINKKEL